MAPIFQIQDLHVSYFSREGELHPALSNISLNLECGEILGVLGESGSGKSTLAAALIGLLPSNGCITGGTVFFEGKNLLHSSAEELRHIRGRHIAVIFQEPSLALHPTMKVGEQVRQVLVAHGWTDRKKSRTKAREVFEPSPQPVKAAAQQAWQVDPLMEVPTLSHQATGQELNDIIGAGSPSVT